jgi:hypothetical protein
MEGAAEQLKAEGWHVYRRNGPNAEKAGAQDLGDSCDRPEVVFRREVKTYITETVKGNK